jgi:hypothetical protein
MCLHNYAFEHWNDARSQYFLGWVGSVSWSPVLWADANVEHECCFVSECVWVVPKVMLPILFCCPTTSVMNAGGMAVEVESTCQ